jgi:hypothetical protein
MGIVAGLLANLLFSEEPITSVTTCPMCPHAHEDGKKKILERFFSILKFGFYTIPKNMWHHLVVGLLLATFISSIAPVGMLIREHLRSGVGYLFALIFGLLIYICSTATVPMVHAFKSEGLNLGAAMTLLLVGPITSYATILVLHKEFGKGVLFLYLFIICLLSLTCGRLFHVL